MGAFNNYAIQGLYTPGSTFKLVTATTELQTGIMSAVSVRGRHRGLHGAGLSQGCQPAGASFTTTTTRQPAKSTCPRPSRCRRTTTSTTWATLLVDQSRYGQTPIQNVAAEYGLSQPTNIDLPDEVQGRVDSPEVRKELHAEAPKAFPDVTWYTGDNIEMAFGQGTTAVTPIALADAYATFANGGTRYAPEVAAAIVNPHGQVVVRYAPHVIGHVNLPAQRPRPDPPGARRRGEQPRRDRRTPLPHERQPLARFISDRRQDRHGEQRSRAKSPTPGSSVSDRRLIRSTWCCA